LFSFESSHSPLNIGSLGRFSNIAGAGFAIVPRGWLGAGRGGSGLSGGGRPFRGLKGLADMSGWGVRGIECSLKRVLVGVSLPKSLRMVGARHLLVEVRSGGHSVSEVC